MTAVPARVGPRRNSRRLHPFSPWPVMATLLLRWMRISMIADACSIDGASGAQPKIEPAILTAPHKWTRAISFDHLVGEPSWWPVEASVTRAAVLRDPSVDCGQVRRLGCR